MGDLIMMALLFIIIGVILGVSFAKKISGFTGAV
jgi:hypothetical protein